MPVEFRGIWSSIVSQRGRCEYSPVRETIPDDRKSVKNEIICFFWALPLLLWYLVKHRLSKRTMPVEFRGIWSSIVSRRGRCELSPGYLAKHRLSKRTMRVESRYRPLRETIPDDRKSVTNEIICFFW